MQDSYINAYCIGVEKKYRKYFPEFGTVVGLVTTDGSVLKARVYNSISRKYSSMELHSIGTELHSLRGWYHKNKNLKKGDIIRIIPIKNREKYHLEIV